MQRMHLGKTRHPDSPPIEQMQKEVLMEEGLFKQIDEPILFKTDADGTEWYYLDLEELGIPIN